MCNDNSMNLVSKLEPFNYLSGISISIHLFPVVPTLGHRTCVKRFVSLQFLDLRLSVGLLGRGISPTQGRYLRRTTQAQNKRRQTSMPSVGVEPTIPVSERAKIFHALDRAATVVGCMRNNEIEFETK
jgi:hypothetical protein